MIITMLFVGAVIAPALYDAVIADPKQAVVRKMRMNAVENAGVLHSKLTGGQYDPRIN